MSEATAVFPDRCRTIGAKIEYLSRVLLPEGRYADYAHLLNEILDEKVHYIDPVHEMHGRDEVIRMLKKYVPRVHNERFRFGLISDGDTHVIWRWTIALKIRFSPFEFVIHGLVHARVEHGKIVYQREYYDPMESIETIPLVGKMYKQVLKMG